MQNRSNPPSYSIDTRRSVEECVNFQQILGHFDPRNWSRPSANSMMVTVVLMMKKRKLSYSRLSVMFSVYKKVTHPARKYFWRDINMAVKVVTESWHLTVISKFTAQRQSTILKHAILLVCRIEATESIRAHNLMTMKLLLLELARCLVTLSAKRQSYKKYILCL
jgi:hypothetical protein